MISVKCEYKKTTTYPDKILIKTSLESYNGIKMKIKYEMINKETEEVYKKFIKKIRGIYLKWHLNI